MEVVQLLRSPLILSAAAQRARAEVGALRWVELCLPQQFLMTAPSNENQIHPATATAQKTQPKKTIPKVPHSKQSITASAPGTQARLEDINGQRACSFFHVFKPLVVHPCPSIVGH